MSKTILVVDDDPVQAGNISAFLARNGWEVEACGCAEEALGLCGTLHPDAVVTDQRLPRLSGIEMMKKLRETDPLVKCIVMTGDDSAQTAVQAMKAGAYDYVVKPVPMAELNMLLERAVGAARVEQALQFHQQRQAHGAGLRSLLGTSPAVQDLKNRIGQVLEAERRVSGEELPAVLVMGETGTGKELVARALHFDGTRSSGPFVEINCASIPSHLLESELFGHEKGAFTDAKERRTGLVEAADGGTLFLDEIGEIDMALQAKLLKLLEEKTVRRVGSVRERKVNLRIISATNRDLEAMVRSGHFRSDLYFRLRIISIQVPTLRSRGADILLLANHFLESHARRYGKPGLRFSPDAEAALLGYYWPGNVRELRNMLEQTVLLTQDRVITPAQLALSSSLAPDAGNCHHTGACGQGCMAPPKNGADLAHIERNLVIKTLEKTGWNVTRSAKMLGLSRDMMRYRIDKMGLSRPADEPGSGFGPD
ncbi:MULTISPECIES: sigma-54-dependent transcriptional regulator [Ramlibacter]|uniref:Response regulator n=1 Tax=Ramlibacter pinisoli TaxID=2682844 RepID=A0A6N8IYE5_9BURK|nr:MULTISPECIES: sigma-54 dependent transcriptional regulator [Ramlibacter]MBA2961856.1 sigma-54-dependent Fis family transcriptional regulator [Ramlibacter sp. CGMCC 1.13660]MVQ31798.1 response regulator [Ramlibacter pinisoli]